MEEAVAEEALDIEGHNAQKGDVIVGVEEDGGEVVGKVCRHEASTVGQHPKVMAVGHYATRSPFVIQHAAGSGGGCGGGAVFPERAFPLQQYLRLIGPLWHEVS